MPRLVPFLALLLAAQSAPEVDLTAEPHHHLVFENQQVRVFHVELPAHGETLLHRHLHDFGYVMLSAARVSNEVKDRAPVEMQLAEGAAGFFPGSLVHRARNLSDQPTRNVTVEYLQDKSLRLHPKKWDEERGLEILHGGTKEILLTNDGVRVSEIELQPGGMIPLHHHAGPHLAVAVTDLDLRSDTPGQPSKSAHLQAGESKWNPGNYSHTLTNTGKQSAKFVVFEFP